MCKAYSPHSVVSISVRATPLKMADLPLELLFLLTLLYSPWGIYHLLTHFLIWLYVVPIIWCLLLIECKLPWALHCGCFPHRYIQDTRNSDKDTVEAQIFIEIIKEKMFLKVQHFESTVFGHVDLFSISCFQIIFSPAWSLWKPKKKNKVLWNF